jgi:WD40 repeat protein
MAQVQGVSKDLRTIGVMSPIRKVSVSEETAEQFSGNYFTVVAATVTEHPRAGSDEIDKAFDECWVGKNGYVKTDKSQQKRAVAFQGNVKDRNGNIVTEVFVSDIPDDITKAVDGNPLEGTADTRPNVPLGLTQRRITFTADRKFPGLQGPRFWLRTSPDGKEVYFLMKDNEGLVQVFQVNTNGGAIRQVTAIGSSIQSQFNVSPDGRTLAFIAGNSIWITDISSGKSTRLTAENPQPEAPVLGVLWSNDGRTLVFNRYVKEGDGRYLQIFKLNLN